MAGPLKKYGFINAKLRARLSHILPDEFINQMIRAHSLPETVQLLADTPYSRLEQVYNNTGDLKMAELELFRQEVSLYVELEKFVKDEVLSLIKALTARFELENLKNILRLWFDRTVRERDINHALGYLYRDKIHHNLSIDAIIHSETIEEVVEALSGTPYAAIIKEAKNTVLKTGSLFSIEIALDHYFYKKLMEEINKLSPGDFQIASRLIGVEIDMQNINWIIRFKTGFKLSMEQALGYCLPFGYNIGKSDIEGAYSSENVTDILAALIKKKYPGFQSLISRQTHDVYSRLILIERILHEIVMKEVRHVMGGYPFTIGIILAYFILKGNEIKKIMTILNAAYYGISEERIKSGL